MEYYTLDEVSKHNTANDLWLVVDNVVYNVTTFLHNHPGGQDALLYNGGKDATEYFHKIAKHGMNTDLPEFIKYSSFQP